MSSPHAATRAAPPTRALEADALPEPKTFRERLAQRWALPKLDKLFTDRLAILSELRSIPDRMQKVTNQARLVIELADDFRTGRYRKISWLTIAIAVASLVYAVSPGDVVPDVIPAIGALDDMVVLTIAMKAIEKDLRAYVKFKGYAQEDYF
ncbi:MAG: DUF1232 domain-containing protein [Polyangiales bacterium]